MVAHPVVTKEDPTLSGGPGIASCDQQTVSAMAMDDPEKQKNNQGYVIQRNSKIGSYKLFERLVP